MPAAMRDAPIVGWSPQGGPPSMYTDEGPGSFGVGIGARGNVSIDGTPSRVAGILILSGAVLAILKLSGFRFNVGVTT